MSVLYVMFFVKMSNISIYVRVNMDHLSIYSSCLCENRCTTETVTDIFIFM